LFCAVQLTLDDAPFEHVIAKTGFCPRHEMPLGEHPPSATPPSGRMIWPSGP
jgi:hypothetical protein